MILYLNKNCSLPKKKRIEALLYMLENIKDETHNCLCYSMDRFMWNTYKYCMEVNELSEFIPELKKYEPNNIWTWFKSREERIEVLEKEYKLLINK